MDWLLLIVFLVFKVFRVFLPWVTALLITPLLLNLAGIRGAGVLPAFLFGFIFVALFLREEVFPLLFKDK
ncbi:MAG: hypothetical protein GTN74_05055 [Proteobacteria bacterium]|nr:hypothetical protein [Pseudomonadota bacterium]